MHRTFRIIGLGMALLGLVLALGGPAAAEPPPAASQAAAQEQPAPEEPWRIQAVNFVGLESLTPAQALEVMETKPAASLLFSRDPLLDPLRLERDRLRLEQLYQEFGFFEATVAVREQRDQDTRRVMVTVEVKENQPTMVTRVEVILPEGPVSSYWRGQLEGVLAIKAGQRFSLKASEDSKDAMAQLLANQAHPQHQLVGQVRVYKAQHQATVVYQVDPGPRLLFGASSVSGERRITPSFIQRELAFTRGQPFSQETLEQSQRALLDTGFFSSVSLTPDFEHVEDGQVPILVQVKEGKYHSVRLGLGWGTEDQFRFRILQVNRNMLGFNDTITFEGKISHIYYGLTGRLKLPYLINRDTTGLVSGGVEQKDNEAFINRRYFVSPVLEYRLPGKWLWYLGYNVEKDRMVELKAAVPNPTYEKQQLYISSVPVGLRFDNRDSPLDTKKGVYFNVEVETASDAIGSEVEFCRPVAELRHVMPMPLLPGWYLASRAKAGFAIPLPGTDRVPLVRRFFPGGADSVRGYAYQTLGPLDSAGKPLGGEAALEGSVEARFPIWRELGGVAFVDMGNAYEDLNSDVGKLRFTTGCGLRYNTPVGPLRLDIGYQLNPPANAPISRYEVYLSVGQAF